MADFALDSESENEAVPFSFSELFFSRTDLRGKIISGNSVFQRISQYDWDEMVGQPHNIIRHPDVPRGVFYLLWDFLKKGKPIGAYVKNRAKDGRHYWVFAIITPIEGGYLSVRIKPSSSVFGVVQGAYRSLLALERGQKLTPKASADCLLKNIQTLGFADYDAFMSHALCEEMAARDAKLGRREQSFLGNYRHLTSCAHAMKNEIACIASSYDESRYVSLNLQIRSAQLGREGAAIGVISSSFRKISDETQEEIDTFCTSAAKVFGHICIGQFLLCTARIQEETLAYHLREVTDTGRTEQETELALLRNQSESYRRQALHGLQDILSDISAFNADYLRMKRCAISLGVIRVMGKVDAARLSDQQSGLSELIEDLHYFQTTVTDSLSKIEYQTAGMKGHVEGIVGQI